MSQAESDPPAEGPKLQNARRWTNGDAERFLEYLIDTGNVTKAADLIGFSRQQLYNKRNEDAVFAARWAAVIEDAKLHTREALVLRARAALEKAAEAAMSVRDIIAVLKHYGPEASRKPIVPLDPEAARAEILEMLLAIKRGGPEALSLSKGEGQA